MRRLPTVLLLAFGVVLVAGVHVGVEKWLEDHVTHGDVPRSLISYGLSALVAVTVLVATEWLSEGLYSASAIVRRLHHWVTGERYLEGWWLDVGIDDRGGLAEVKNCSFITIVHDEDEELHIEGLSWETHSLNVFSWHSFYTKLEKRTLYFGHEYTSTQGGLTTEGKQTSRFSFHLDNISFEGGFDGERYRSMGRQHRRSGELFRRATVLSETERRQLARDNMHRFMRENGYDLASYRQISTRPLLDRKEWFLTFVKATDQKKAERDLLLQLLGTLTWPQTVQNVLELGPGDGALTCEALKLGTPSLAQARYVGVDSNGSLLDELAVRLQLQCGRADDGHTVLRRQSMEGFLASGEAGFDLILALNSLYFVGGLGNSLSRLWAKLSPGGRLVAMHSDLESASVVTDLLTRYNPGLNRNVVATLDAGAAHGGLVKLSSMDSRTEIGFPALTKEGVAPRGASGRRGSR